MFMIPFELKDCSTQSAFYMKRIINFNLILAPINCEHLACLEVYGNLLLSLTSNVRESLFRILHSKFSVILNSNLFNYSNT